MTRRHQLEESLRALKLSGMLDTLEARLLQTKSGDFGHLEFLQALCQDELSRREAAAIERRVRNAGFESPATLEGFDFSYNPKLPAPQIRDLATLHFVESGQSVILHGPVGVGKTHLAQALAHHACRRGHTALFGKTSRLLADLAGGRVNYTWGMRLKRWAKFDLLVLDDFAMRDFTAPQADDLYELVTERAGKSLILTSNRSPENWYPLFPNPVVAESVLDRIINSSHHLHLEGRSYRPQQRPKGVTTD